MPSPAGSPAPLDPPGYSPVEPVLRGSFADPTVIRVAGTYFAYGTNNADAVMPVVTAATRPATTSSSTASSTTTAVPG